MRQHFWILLGGTLAFALGLALLVPFFPDSGEETPTVRLSQYRLSTVFVAASATYVAFLACVFGDVPLGRKAYRVLLIGSVIVAWVFVAGVVVSISRLADGGNPDQGLVEAGFDRFVIVTSFGVYLGFLACVIGYVTLRRSEGGSQ